MNSFLYIGQYTEGTTSKMRANKLSLILKPKKFEVIDTHIPFFKTHRVFRSFGFRYKRGPLIKAINNYIQNSIKEQEFDLIWIDKGIFITEKTVKLLNSKSTQIVHFTPDMAFYANQSNHFNASINCYDYLVTTKSKELDFYERYVSKEKLILVTQGFDKRIHKPFHTFEEKDNAIVFIGLAEPSRIAIAEKIIKNHLTLKLVGKGWEVFVEKHKSNKNLIFLGDAIYSEDYSRLLSSSKFGLGLLSKQFPELHTTRTFEIPACGAALLTEKNSEIASFFKENEAIFYTDLEDLITKVKYFLNNASALETLTNKGYNAVHNNGYDYESIMRHIINKIL
jgi:spore maturation protein CgeB